MSQPSEQALAVAACIYGIRMTGRKEWAIELWATEIQRSMDAIVELRTRDIKAERDRLLHILKIIIPIAKPHARDKDLQLVRVAELIAENPEQKV